MTGKRDKAIHYIPSTGRRGASLAINCIVQQCGADFGAEIYMCNAIVFGGSSVVVQLSITTEAGARSTNPERF